MHSTHDSRKGCSLRSFFPHAKIFGDPNLEVFSCCSDPQQCQPGDLFVALMGAEEDSHDLVGLAIERGAIAVVCERYLPIAVPQCIVTDSREAYGRLCQALLDFPAEKMSTLAITGSNGKTVTAMLTAAVLAAKSTNSPVGVISSLGHSDGIQQSAALRTTPPQPELADWFRRMAANGCEHAVVEVSSKAMADRRLAGVNFDAVVLTNFRRDHLPEHHSTANYRRLKTRLFRQLKPDGFAVLNADDPLTPSILQKLRNPVLTFGMKNSAEVMATVLERFNSEQTFLLTAGNDSVPVRTTMIGDHHVYNCLAAACVGLVLGLDLTTIARGLEQVAYVPGRLEQIVCGQPFSVYVDGAKTPDAIAASLRAVRQVTRGRVIAVLGSEAGTDGARRAELGSVLERGSHVAVLTNDNPGTEQPLQIIHDLLDGFDKPARPQISPDRATA